MCVKGKVSRTNEFQEWFRQTTWRPTTNPLIVYLDSDLSHYHWHRMPIYRVFLFIHLSFVSSIEFIVEISPNIYGGFCCVPVPMYGILSLENQLKTGVSFQNGMIPLSIAHPQCSFLTPHAIPQTHFGEHRTWNWINIHIHVTIWFTTGIIQDS